MNKFLFRFILVIQTFIITTKSFSQIQKENNNNSYQQSKWIIGTGLNGVNDDGYLDKNYFDLKNSWSANFQTINIDRKLFKDFYLNAMFSKNLYKVGMRKDMMITTSPTHFTSFDLNIKYTFESYLPKNYWLEPYAYIGYGYTNREIDNIQSNNSHNYTKNLGIGTFIWLGEHWGVNLQASGKWSTTKEQTNYKQNIIGVVYRISN